MRNIPTTAPPHDPEANTFRRPRFFIAGGALRTTKQTKQYRQDSIAQANGGRNGYNVGF
jgi:hypothetical protein